jgi:hypothetical protein
VLKPQNKLKQYWAEQAEKSRTPPTEYVRASMLGVCLRQIAYYRIGTEPADYTYEDYMPMYLGRILHEVIQADLQKAGVRLRGCEETLRKTYKVTVAFEGYDYEVEVPIVGHQDGKTPIKGGTCLEEFKTFSQWRYQRYVDANILQLWTDFYREMIQTMVYIDMGKHLRSRVWGFNRSNGQFLVHDVEFDKKRLRHRIKQIAVMLVMLDVYDGEKLPDREYEPSHILCKICNFRHTCHGRSAQNMR